MNNNRELLYVSDVVPGAGLGGSIIIDRHLRRLAAEGWTVTIVSPFGQAAAAGPWREIRLPARRWWWPPFRPGQPALAALRSLVWRHELKTAGLTRADQVLTICWGSMSWLAASLAEAFHAPLTAIVHDWWRETGSVNDTLIGRHACRAARTVFAVSREMQAALTAECGCPIDLLYPIPSARSLPFATWKETFGLPGVAHVGSLQPYHEPFLTTVAEKLARQGGRLLLLCPRNNPVADALSRRCTNLVRQDFFPENAQALAWVAAHASALVVMYPVGLDAEGRPPTGFPSRLVEFSQLGLPVMLAAPAGNPVRAWAAERGWTGSCDPGDPGAIERWLGALAESAGWERFAAETRSAATGDFDPEQLHRIFVSALSD